MLPLTLSSPALIARVASVLVKAVLLQINLSRRMAGYIEDTGGQGASLSLLNGNNPSQFSTR
jgi:hypothetical protein